jgi:presenilin-like A22 family membrane protease
VSSEKDTFRDYIPMVVMAGLILVVQSLALFLASPMEDLGMRAVENPESTANSLYYIGFILVFTFLLLMAIKRNMKWVIQLTILLAVAATVYYGFYPVFFILGFNPAMSNAIAIPLAIALTALLYKFPEWYIIDITGNSRSSCEFYFWNILRDSPRHSTPEPAGNIRCHFSL